MSKSDVVNLLGLLAVCCLAGFGVHQCSAYHTSRSRCLMECREAAQGLRPGRNLIQAEYDACNAACAKLP